MPELPEVETIARQLHARIAGKRVAGFSSSWSRLTEPEPAALFAARLAGRRVSGVRRRAKLVAFDLDGGDALVVSLRMTGQLLYSAPRATRSARGPLSENGGASDPYVRGVIAFDDGSALRFRDVRKFGRMSIVDAAELADTKGDYVARRGPLHRAAGREPLERGFTARWLHTFLRRRRNAAIKPLLLDPRGIAGIGNIYACEALWRARLHPLRRAGSLRPLEVARLREALRRVLRKGIRLGGASRRDYVDANGREGRMQREFQAYGRAGEPCPRRDGGAIRRTVVGGRGTFHCPRCQLAPRTR